MMRYNLNKNNCTDFGLSAAMIAGINIKETVGPLAVGPWQQSGKCRSKSSR